MEEYKQHSSKEGFPTKTIQQMKEKEAAKLNKKRKQRTREAHKQQQKMGNIHLPQSLNKKVTNLFKNTDIRIAFRTSNTIHQQVAQKTNNQNPSGIYEIKCNTCGLNYIGQSCKPITTRHKEHIRYIRNNNPASENAVHILNNRHEFGTTDNTLQLIKQCRKSSKMNHCENMYIHI
jgi:hypothetical protein